MTTKNIVLAICVALLAGYAFGRYGKNDKVIEMTKTVSTDTKKDTTVTDAKKDVHTTTTIVVKPDGEKITTISDNSIEETKTRDKSTDVAKTDSETYKEVLNNTNKLNISALAGAHFPVGVNPLVYGLSIQKSLIGPITIGAWGLSDKTVGFSLGISW